MAANGVAGRRRGGANRRRSASLPAVVAAMLAAVLVGGGLVAPGTAGAVPPPPPNPSDEELDETRAQESERADEVGRLANQLTEAEQELDVAQAEIARKRELANKAQVDLERAEDAAEQAASDAEQAAADSEQAGEQIAEARERMDTFVAGSYTQGNSMGAAASYLGSEDRSDLLDRQQMLGAVGESNIDAIEEMRVARIEKSNAEAAATEAAELTEQRETEAEDAQQAADAAVDTAIEAGETQAARTEELEDERDVVAEELHAAQASVSDLEGQRESFEEWEEERERERERQAREAALAEAERVAAEEAEQEAAQQAEQESGGSSGEASAEPQEPAEPQQAEPQEPAEPEEPAEPQQQAEPQAPAEPRAPATPDGVNVSIETVIERATSQIGVPYAWGGGNTEGPTQGVRDGGVADAHGDFNKIGFDCSGLMVYAFAPHRTIEKFSGHQFDEGRKVPLSEKRRGDLLFWGNAGIYHVAMYLGDGMMIEAPQSGGQVQITPVRHGDILPQVTRIIE